MNQDILEGDTAMLIYNLGISAVLKEPEMISNQEREWTENSLLYKEGLIPKLSMNSRGGTEEEVKKKKQGICETIPTENFIENTEKYFMSYSILVFQYI